MMSSYGTGRMQASTSDAVIKPRVSVARTPLVYASSAASAGTASEALGFILPSVNAHLRILVDQGFSSATVTTGWTFGVAGLDGAALDDVIAYHRSALLGTSDPVVLIGTSMGVIEAIIYALEHPGEVACIIGFSPVFDLVESYENDIGGSRNEIEAAWGVTYPDPLPATADSMGRASELQSVPMKLWYANDDVYAANIGSFASASGAEIVDVGALGHGEAVIAAVDPADVRDFVLTHTGG